MFITKFHELAQILYFQITHMQASGAIAVIIMAEQNQPIVDLNCQGAQCTADLHIPVSMVPYQDGLNM